MKRLVIVFILFGIAFNLFALELSNFRKAKTETESSVLELLDDTEDYERGFDWIVIPEVNTEPEPVELPNKSMYQEKEKSTLDIFDKIIKKVKELLQKQE